MQKTAMQAVREIWKASGLSQKKLAEKMEIKSQQTVFGMLKAKHGIRADNFVKMMNIFGYDVVIRNRVNDEEIEIITKADDAE